MKRTFFILIGLLFSFDSFSQAYRPIPLDSATWIEKNWYYPTWLVNHYCNISHYRQVYPSGDTTIGVNTYRVFRYNETTISNSVGSVSCINYYLSNMLYAFIRNDSVNKKVYYWNPDSVSEKILYDFSLTIGDTLSSDLGIWADESLCNGLIYHIVSEDSIDVGGEFRRRLGVQSTDTTMPICYMIEGIGSNQGLGYYGFCLGEFYHWSQALVCYNDPNIHFSPYFNQSYCIENIGFEDETNTSDLIRNTGSNTFFITNNNKEPIEISCFDMLGKFILKRTFHESEYIEMNHLTSGVYFLYVLMNGKTLKPYKFVISH